MVRAFRHRNYRLFFSGQIISLTGTWLSMVATNWLVYRLARESGNLDTAAVLGMVGFVGQIPIFLLSPFAGVWIDRLDRRRVLLVTQTLSMLQSFALGILAWQGMVTIFHIVVLNVLQGMVNALDLPTRQALVVEVVEDRNDLSNAIALNSSMVHLARSIGPVIAGYLIASVGEAACFLIDGFSFVFVLAAIWVMRIHAPKIQVAAKVNAFQSLREGVFYAYQSKPIRILLLVAAVTSLMTMSQSVLMPIIADQILGGGEQTLGKLLGASGLGAVIGSIYLASRRTVLGLGRVIVIASVSLGAGLILFGWSTNMLVSLLALFVIGGAMVVQMASTNTLLQTLVDDDKRGRIMSLFTMCFVGMAPFGSLLAGQLASHFGVRVSITIAGIACILTGLIFASQRPSLRRLALPILQAKS